MSTRTLYRRYLEIVQHWPLDPNKPSRDLGVYIRSRINKHFPKGEITPIDSSSIPTLTAEIDALERLTTNINRDSNRYKDCSTASGMTAEQLSHVTSSESIKSFNEFYDSGMVNSLKYRFFSIFIMFELLKEGPYVCIHCGYPDNKDVYKIYGDQVRHHSRSPSSALWLATTSSTTSTITDNNDVHNQQKRSKLTPRLTKCQRCQRLVDEYVQLDYNILYLDAILQKISFYRHILHNCRMASNKRISSFKEMFMSLIICSYGKLFLLPCILYGGDLKPILELFIKIFYLFSLVQCSNVKSHSMLNRFYSILLVLFAYLIHMFLVANLHWLLPSKFINKLQYFLV
ncbi:Eukaryotic translation initiation factor 4 gamma 2 [Dermatophagoides pteronyssinus]|uniref:Protein ARV n=1 Tax=Dermatophagoides pteronyssinus TaxID=6956 RepID=A0ABQ8J8P3_DERPT|nr:Eukaryotic translation initiation factor 4 gamma 2 [Dermatophagoides pteronyssinus]